MDLNKALEIARSAAIEAGEELIKHYGNVEYEAKTETGNTATDIVTKLDRQTESLLSERLSKFDSGVGFRGEEFGVTKEGSKTWLVDPIDGTNHFVRGLPFCNTMIALIDDGQVVLSVIHDFVRKDTYWAIKGQGAYKNDQKIHVSNRSLNQSLLSFETHQDKPENQKPYFQIQKDGANIISTVNCGFEFSMVASGRYDARLAFDGYGFDWDYAPGSLLVQEAGGIVANIGSNKYDYKNHNLIATNPVIFKELTEGKNPIFPILSS